MKLLIYEDWKNSASARDGLTPQQEIKFHYEMYEFARAIETYLKNSDKPAFHNYFQKGLSLFHRFAHQVSFRAFDRYIYMTASLFLSAKDQDMFDWSIDRYVRQYLNYCSKKSDATILQKDIYPIQLPNAQLIEENPPTFDKHITQLYTSKILDAEAHILKMVGYDLNIILPQMYFIEAPKKISLVVGDSNKLFETAQKLLTDLFMTNLCLYYQPKILALAAIFQATLIYKYTIEDQINGQSWYTIFDDPNQEDVQNNTKYSDIQDACKHFEECLKAIKG